MADGFSVGVSSFGDLRGVEQFVASEDVAAQVRSLCLEFNTQVAKNGDRLTVNEGIRSRARQDALYQAWKTYQKYGRPYASLAANPYTSTHDHTRGSALDFGITRADGSNRALTQAEFDWVHTNGVRRGIRWTGGNFRPVEQWHHNGGYPATVPPIADAPINNTITPRKDDDMPKLELRQDETGTIWLCRDRMERRSVANMQELADLQFMIEKLGQDKEVSVGPVAGFGVDISVRKDEFQLVKDPKGNGTVFLSWRRLLRIPIGAANIGDYQYWLGKNGYYADVLADSNLGAYGADIRNVNKIGA